MRTATLIPCPRRKDASGRHRRRPLSLFVWPCTRAKGPFAAKDVVRRRTRSAASRLLAHPRKKGATPPSVGVVGCGKIGLPIHSGRESVKPQDLERRSLAKYFPGGVELNLRRYPLIEDLRSLAVEVGYDVVRVRDTHSYNDLPAEEVLAAVRGKHNTTLALLDEEQFHEGYNRLEADLAGRSLIRIDHYHTILVFRRP